MGRILVEFAQMNGWHDPAQLEFLRRINGLWDQQIINRFRSLLTEKGSADLGEVIKDVVGKNNLLLPPPGSTQPRIRVKETPVRKLKGRFAPYTQKLGEIFSNKWVKIGAVATLLIIILIVAILLFGNSNPGTTYRVPTRVPEQPTQQIIQSPLPTPSPVVAAPPITIEPMTRVSLSGLDIKIYLLSLGLVGLFLFSLLESVARGDYILLDFFATWGLISLFEFGQIHQNYSTWAWGVFFGVGILGMIVATVINPSEENEPSWWNRIDTTHWYVAGLALIIIYLMKSVVIPYPTYIPIIIPILATIVGVGKEIFRQVMYSLLAIAVGIIPAVLQTPVALALGLAAEVGIAAVAAHQGWINTRGTGHDINIGGRKFQLFMAWDVVLFYVAEVVLIGYALYGNYALLAITR